jgi:hypothetical protein
MRLLKGFSLSVNPGVNKALGDRLRDYRHYSPPNRRWGAFRHDVGPMSRGEFP